MPLTPFYCCVKLSMWKHTLIKCSFSCFPNILSPLMKLPHILWLYYQLCSAKSRQWYYYYYNLFVGCMDVLYCQLNQKSVRTVVFWVMTPCSEEEHAREQHVLSQLWYPSTRLYGVIREKTTVRIFNSMKTSNLTKIIYD